MKKTKILLYDIETAPNLAYVWGKWQQDVIAYEKERELLCFSYKWFGEGNVKCDSREKDKSDKRIVKSLAKLISEADIIVAHNGDEFDKKVLKARMVYHGLKPLPMTASVDTKKVAKAYFSFNGNSLADLCRYLKIGEKAKHPGFDMWLGCMRGNRNSWKQMENYNKVDVIVLEKLYERFLPWIENHPNNAKILNKDSLNSCPTCTSKHIIRRGIRATAASVSQRWGCQSCGRYFLTRVKKGK